MALIHVKEFLGGLDTRRMPETTPGGVLIEAVDCHITAGGAKDAQLKLDQANAIYVKLRGNLTPRKQFRMFGIGEDMPPRRIVISQYRRPSN